ncbi:MAG: hypothetical protein FWD78_01005 [Treponema sp.]|nr:hypothetical protein [Treponema sp.]
MGQYIEALLLTTTAAVLLWFGYNLFFGNGVHITPGSHYYSHPKKHRKNRFGWKYSPQTGMPGDPRTCPVCSAKLDEGLLVKSLAYPSLNGGKDRMMHIKGCVYCLRGNRDRICPVCGHVLLENEVLICRMFERPFTFSRRPHVHVLGCSRCR